MYDYKKTFVVGAVVFAIVFMIFQLFTLSSQVAQHHASNSRDVEKIADLLV